MNRRDFLATVPLALAATAFLSGPQMAHNLEKQIPRLRFGMTIPLRRDMGSSAGEASLVSAGTIGHTTDRK